MGGERNDAGRGAIRVAVVASVVVLVVVVAVLPLTAAGAPLITSFDDCQTAEFAISKNIPRFEIQCCPKLPAGPILDGLPPATTRAPRVRPAAQCTDAAYAAKLQRGYELMRALPDDDPRSFTMQWKIHCAYCGGAFNNPTGRSLEDGLNVHFSWLFYPWHRFFVYFHERILQTLLDDPTFSLSYWNWDNPFTVGDGHSGTGACLKAGHDFPLAYSPSSASTYDANRSDAAKGIHRNKFADLSYQPSLVPREQPLFNLSSGDYIHSNLNVMYQSLVSGGTTTETFLGLPLDTYPKPTSTTAAGLLAYTAHRSVHFWTGNQRPPDDTFDMGGLVFSARDPVFYAHHGNIDRLWEVWRTLGKNRVDFSDPDFLDTEFLFFDENKDLRRVKIRDSLDTKKLGYVYQQANDVSWLKFRPERCTNMKYHELVAHVEGQRPQARDPDGLYRLRAGAPPFVVLVDRPENPFGAEEFLVISGIRTDVSRSAGFDVFVNLPEPGEQRRAGSVHKCAEYRGRFAIMAESRRALGRERRFVWKESISTTVVDVGAPPAPSKLAVTIVPLPDAAGDAAEPLAFASVAVVVAAPPSLITERAVSAAGSTTGSSS